MELPKRTKQQKSEAHSYAILLYKLKDLGIFRNLTNNDYGIDFELELVKEDQVTGRLVKIQVKSAEKLKFRADGTLAVGGVKQSTLNYWCELSYRTNVIAYAVDLESETIYISRDLFWQASTMLDGSNSTKSIEFISAETHKDLTARIGTLVYAYAPNVADHIYAHTMTLRRINDFLRLLVDAYHYDAGTEVDSIHFRDMLEAARILLWHEGHGLWKDESDKKYWTSYAYWVRKSEADNWDGLSCFFAQSILSTIIPAMVRKLRYFKSKVIEGKYYWANKNPQFLKLVYETPMPDADDKESIIKWSYENAESSIGCNYDADNFVWEARKPTPSRKCDADPKAPKKQKKSLKIVGA